MANGTISQPTNVSTSSYCKMPDGTLICRKEVEITNHSVTSPWGSCYESDSSIDLGTWPMDFISLPTVVMHLNSMSGFLERIANPGTHNIGSTYICRPNSTSSGTYSISIIGVGRWK